MSIPILHTKKHRALALVGVLLALACLAIGFPEIVDGFRQAARGRQESAPPWSTAAALCAFPGWLWAAVSCVRRRQWGWLLVISGLSHLGMLAYLAVGSRHYSARATGPDHAGPDHAGPDHAGPDRVTDVAR
ncbi:MAG: PLD nuclease N-terminal domain-containing protein [Angustibacter sp.]